MQQSQLIKKILLTTVSMFTFMGSVYADSIGDIVESTGIGGIVRNNETLPIDVGSDIVLYDDDDDEL